MIGSDIAFIPRMRCISSQIERPVKLTWNNPSEAAQGAWIRSHILSSTNAIVLAFGRMIAGLVDSHTFSGLAVRIG